MTSACLRSGSVSGLVALPTVSARPRIGTHRSRPGHRDTGGRCRGHCHCERPGDQRQHSRFTNAAGSYSITPLTVGSYVIKAELAGFRTAATAPIVLEARQVARLDLRMAVGQLAETVQVAGSSPILQTETVTVGEVLSGNTVQSLPLNGRNTGQLALLLPGTVTYNPRGFTNIGSINMNRPFVNGNREQTNNFTVDGLDVNETIDNRVAINPAGCLAEISVETQLRGRRRQRRRSRHPQRDYRRE